MKATTAPGLEFALELRVTIGATVELGASAAGIRRTVPILGGSFAGPEIAGQVLEGGADWQLCTPSGLTLVDARYALETRDGARIEVRNRGVRHGPTEVMARIARGETVPPNEYYFRTSPCFSPPDGRYEWLRNSIFVASAERHADLVVVRVWRVC
jgi:hypothetical protein